MHGFGSFREPTTVDFTGADYFALTGPTGSGKSTVIDAITFALYGSVPRWDDRRRVNLALAPTANRGTVRLVFDVSGARYVVARELRRAKAGTVTVRNARLERLTDPAGVGALGEPTETLASDSAATPEVEQLLGLSFENFCTCVVLPQGDFADFMHAKPGDRQKILTKLLGLDVYETIAKEAGAEANSAQQRADALGDQLAEYTHATPEAAAAAAARADRLADLARQVDASVPLLVAAAAAVQAALDDVDRLAGERALLAELKVPDGLAELGDQLRQTSEVLAGTQAAVAAAEAAGGAARARIAAGPARGPLEQTRRDHADLAAARAAEPAARQRRQAAAAALAAAAEAASQAREQVDTARVARDTAVRDLAETRAELTRLTADRDRLAGITRPAGIGGVSSRRQAAQAAVTAAATRLAAAEAEDAAARRTLADAAPRGPLEHARRNHVELADARAAAPGRHERLVAAADRHAETTSRVERAEQRVRAADQARDAATRADLAASLRPHLAAAEPCPVCAQPVATLPPPLPAADLAAADTAVAEADRAAERARRAEIAAALAEQRARSDRETVTGTIQRLQTALADAPPTLAAVDDQLGELDRRAAAASHAAEVLRTARAAHDTATAHLGAVRAELAALARDLQAARDPLVGLGAPEVDDDVVGGWATLTAWAREEAAARERDVGKLGAAAATADQAGALAERAFAAADAVAARLRRAETAAARADQQAQTQLDDLTARIGRLAAALAGAPDPEQTAGQLALLDELAAAARAADEELRRRRAQRAAAETAATDVRRRLDQAWDALQAARDPLVPLGPPPVTPDDVLGAWHTLAAWAHRETVRRDERRPAGQQAVRTARSRFDEAEHRLAEQFRGHDVPLPADRPLVDAAGQAVARAVERARAAQSAIEADLDRANRIRLRRVETQSAAEVARMLAQLLRSDGFPRWLVASALDGLVVDASRTLSQLSGGQFELTHDDAGFLVVDHSDADSHRPVKTLSGGETFQASLALALALSAQMSALAADGAARLDSIFLDEGFGALDESTVDVVAATLEGLAAGGDRMVGIVTHVAALAERVPVRFAVTRDQHTSAIRREDQ
jgi:exonuclease SbcC